MLLTGPLKGQLGPPQGRQADSKDTSGLQQACPCSAHVDRLNKRQEHIQQRDTLRISEVARRSHHAGPSQHLPSEIFASNVHLTNTEVPPAGRRSFQRVGAMAVSTASCCQVPCGAAINAAPSRWHATASAGPPRTSRKTATATATGAGCCSAVTRQQIFGPQPAWHTPQVGVLTMQYNDC